MLFICCNTGKTRESTGYCLSVKEYQDQLTTFTYYLAPGTQLGLPPPAHHWNQP